MKCEEGAGIGVGRINSYGERTMTVPDEAVRSK